MGNHYDPGEERMSQEFAAGEAMRNAVAAKNPNSVYFAVRDIHTRLLSVEASVIGGAAIDTLRNARAELDRLFRP